MKAFLFFYFLLKVFNFSSKNFSFLLFCTVTVLSPELISRSLHCDDTLQIKVKLIRFLPTYLSVIKINYTNRYLVQVGIHLYSDLFTLVQQVPGHCPLPTYYINYNRIVKLKLFICQVYIFFISRNVIQCYQTYVNTSFIAINGANFEILDGHHFTRYQHFSIITIISLRTSENP